MKLKKKEHQRVVTSILLRRRNRIPMEGISETKCGTETEGMTIQRLPHSLGDPPHQQPPNPDNRQMPTRAC
jgi:hypothetical protein